MRALLVLLLIATVAPSQIAIKADMIHTVAGKPIADGVVIVRDGRIAAVGPASAIQVPAGFEVLTAKVCIPGLIDAHTVVGLAGYLNQDQDQDQLDRTSPIQPELRAIDAYNAKERLVDFVRSLGVTTLHTGHAPGALISGQTMIVKTAGATTEEAVRKPFAMVACTLGESAQGKGGKSPGSRGKVVAMLRAQLLKAQRYAADKKEGKDIPRDLGLDALADVLSGEVPLLVTVNRATDIMTALRIKQEFGLNMILDSAADAHMVLDDIKAAQVSVIVHAPLVRARGERENATFELAAKLHQAKIPFAFQSGYESYVPKTRIVLFEAAIAAAFGLGFDATLHALTRGAAELLGIADRVGSIEVGKDADLALYDGDPFEYTTHCVGVIIDGKVASRTQR